MKSKLLGLRTVTFRLRNSVPNFTRSASSSNIHPRPACSGRLPTKTAGHLAQPKTWCKLLREPSAAPSPCTS